MGKKRRRNRPAQGVDSEKTANYAQLLIYSGNAWKYFTESSPVSPPIMSETRQAALSGKYPSIDPVDFMFLYHWNGTNMILTPIFTPPLDTDVGGERPTVQLIDVSFKDNEYHFGFANLKRWVGMCKRSGVEYFEFSHLFTQWGGTAPSQDSGGH